MPFCIVSREYTIDPEGHNNADDFEQVLVGEVVRLMSGDDLILAGIVNPIADSDIEQIVTCKCGRMFSGAKHPHFTHAGLEAQLYNMNEQLAGLEEGTEAHAALTKQIERQRSTIAGYKNTHFPKKADAAEPTAPKRKRGRPRKQPQAAE